jgi:putative transposase
LTTVTEGRVRLFDELQFARALVAGLRAADALGWSKTWAFVVMPDHLHWLFELGEEPLPRLVLRVKSCSAIAINRLRGGSGRVWQKGFHDRALRREEDLRAVARYVVANPLRAGMVSAIGDYPHWDARWLGADGSR